MGLGFRRLSVKTTLGAKRSVNFFRGIGAIIGVEIPILILSLLVGLFMPSTKDSNLVGVGALTVGIALGISALRAFLHASKLKKKRRLQWKSPFVITIAIVCSIPFVITTVCAFVSMSLHWGVNFLLNAAITVAIIKIWQYAEPKGQYAALRAMDQAEPVLITDSVHTARQKARHGKAMIVAQQQADFNAREAQYAKYAAKHGINQSSAEMAGQYQQSVAEIGMAAAGMAAATALTGGGAAAIAGGAALGVALDVGMDTIESKRLDQQALADANATNAYQALGTTVPGGV